MPKQVINQPENVHRNEAVPLKIANPTKLKMKTWNPTNAKISAENWLSPLQMLIFQHKQRR